MSCQKCKNRKAVILRSQNKTKVCKECFFELFEDEIHHLIINTQMFEKNSRVGVGISGGKDSTVLAYVLSKLNIKYKYGIEIVLLCIDEGIDGYRDRSIETVIANQKLLNLEMKILSYKDIFGITMDEVVSLIGKRGNCMYCGVFRRQALEEAARIMKVDCIVTGHNADDMAETVLLNFIRGDYSRLCRCSMSRTNEYLKLDENNNNCKKLSLSRCKPFKLTYQKEIVFYAYFKNLNYFSTECTYAPNASRGDVRSLIKDLENINSEILTNIIKAAEHFHKENEITVKLKKCSNCEHPTSSLDGICAACGMIKKLKSFDMFSGGCSKDDN